MATNVDTALNALVTAALAPGILAHEYAHVLACRLWSVDVHVRPTLNPWGDDAYLDHAPIESFGADLTVALAPLAVNLALGLTAFGLARSVQFEPATLVALYLGACFGLTAAPSAADTAGLVDTARTLSPPLRPLGYLLAVPARTVPRLPGWTDVSGFVLTLALYVAAANVPPFG